MVSCIAQMEHFELDERPGYGVMCHRIGTGAVEEALGMAQQEIFVPVKLK